MSAYCVAADLYARFGTSNITTWATLTSGDSEATRTARITEAIAVASDELDEVLRTAGGGAYEGKLPISTVPDSVTDKVAIRAGLWLYGFRATDDFGDSTGYPQWMWKQYRTWLNEVHTGYRKLEIL